MVAAIVEGIVQGTGTFLAELVGAPRAWLVSPGDMAGDLSAGDLEELQFLNSSSTVACTVLAIDTISRPNRAKVELVDSSEVMVVPVLDEVEAARWSSHRSAQKEVEGHVDETAMVVGAKTTVYQDFDDAFDIAEDRLAALEAAPLPAEEDIDPATAAVAPAGSLSESGGKLLRDLREGLTQEFRDLGEDLCDLAAGAADVAAVGARVLLPSVKAA
eukprot:CAMPEP_0115442232 /NCGR_PEP_ID=MMETSP0271-20121206/37238_1 /TAXON_ID=71861 /ORGANISM="Scrippsiella trochoidea, Strain CCMP3099" /LENGTH=215 /DNA_ID=CAMNT_0002868053 /DNA_START=32 /DNA_END=676 /DNA_ORIENTATION=-